MRILITGGPTHEAIDRVRVVTNPSTGRMGMELAKAAARRGHQAVLVTGPTHLPDPPRVKTIRVTSALEMEAAVKREFPKCDAMIGSAAVSDYRPEKALKNKMKKGPSTLTLKMVKNPDILAGCGDRKGARILVGFALETDCGLENASDKLRRKNLDLIVLNSPEAFAAAEIVPVFLTPDAPPQPLGRMTKAQLSARIVKFIEQAREAPAPRESC